MTDKEKVVDFKKLQRREIFDRDHVEDFDMADYLRWLADWLDDIEKGESITAAYLLMKMENGSYREVGGLGFTTIEIVGAAVCGAIGTISDHVFDERTE